MCLILIALSFEGRFSVVKCDVGDRPKSDHWKRGAAGLLKHSYRSQFDSKSCCPPKVFVVFCVKSFNVLASTLGNKRCTRKYAYAYATRPKFVLINLSCHNTIQLRVHLNEIDSFHPGRKRKKVQCMHQAVEKDVTCLFAATLTPAAFLAESASFTRVCACVRFHFVVHAIIFPLPIAKHAVADGRDERVIRRGREAVY